jgi:acyl carrier protein
VRHTDQAAETVFGVPSPKQGTKRAWRPLVNVDRDRILEIVQKQVPEDMPAITAETRIEDSGIDSYGLIEIVFELEDELEIDIPYNANDGAFGEAETIGDLLDKLQALIEQA